MHEGVNFYGVNGSIGNSIVVGQTQSGFINALDILEMVNSQNGDYPDFALEGNAPVGSLNCTASRELGIDAFTIETSQKLPMEVRVSQQVLIVTNILQQYGMEFKLRPESGDNRAQAYRANSVRLCLVAVHACLKRIFRRKSEKLCILHWFLLF